jgi:hypothetical protein
MSMLTPELPSGVALPTARKSGRWRSVLLGLVIFTCGLVIGAGVAVVVVQKMVLHAITHPEEFPQRVAQRLRSKLALTDEQASQVKAIITRRQKTIQAIRREFQPRLEQELDLTKEEVSAVLGPTKARQWQQRFEYFKRLWLPPPPGHAEPPPK